MQKDRVLKRKVVQGFAILGVQRILFQVILSGSNVVLARILEPSIFGAFAIVSFIILTIGILTNGGLAQALIQKKRDVSKHDIQAVLSTVLLASLVFVIVIYLIAPLFDVLYQGKIGSSGVFWIRIYSLYIPLANIYALSIALIERKLEYGKVMIATLLTLFATQGSSVILSFLGWGIGGLVTGSLFGLVVGIGIMYFLNPWSIGLYFSKKTLQPFIGFGINYQVSTLIGALNSAVIPGYIGIVSGPTAVGYITVMGGIRQAGLAPADTMSKLLFASSSRGQANKKLLLNLVEKMIRFSSMASLPLLGVLFALAPQVITIVLSQKWLPALSTLYLSIFQGIFLLLSTIFIQVLLGLGYARFVRNTTLIWTVVQWALTPIFVLMWGYNGVVIAGIVVSLLFFIPLKKLKSEINISVFSNFVPYLIYSTFLAAVTYLLAQKLIVDSFVKLILVGFISISLYFLFIIIIERKQLLVDLKMIHELMLNKK